MTDLTVIKELFNARFDALEAKMGSMSSVLGRENDRQDEAIERLTDRMTPFAETKRLTERIEKLENQIEQGRNHLNEMYYKIKVTWTVGTIIGGLFLSILAAIVKGWIGV